MKLTREEIEAGVLNPETLRVAVDQVKMKGYVILEEVIPQAFVDELLAAFKPVFHSYVERLDPSKKGENSPKGRNRYLTHLPFMKPFADSSIIANSLALAVVEGVLGKNIVNGYLSADTPLADSDYQNVHRDCGAFFPGHAITLPAYALVVNINLVDFREDNGPLEYWPGTHLIPENVSNLEEAAKYIDSEPAIMKAGSLFIRDVRMWHRGTPNRSTEMRPNMALIYRRPWYSRGAEPQLGIPKETYEAMSPREKELYKLENIGGPLVNLP